MKKEIISKELKIQAIKNIEQDFRKIMDYSKNESITKEDYYSLFDYLYNKEYYDDESLSSFELDYYIRLSKMLENEIQYLR